MQTKKNTTIEPDDTVPLPKGVTWSEFITRISEEKNQQFLKKISPLTFKFILVESNRPKIIDSILKTLKQTDPKNATNDYVEQLITAMKVVAESRK